MAVWSDKAADIKSVAFGYKTVPSKMRGWFRYHSNLLDIDLGRLDASGVTNFERLFQGCESLASGTDLDLGGLVASPTIVATMFANCKNIQSVDLSGFSKNDSTETSVLTMFGGCEELKKIYVKENFVVPSNLGGDTLNTFHNCTNLVGGLGTVYDENNVHGDYARIDAAPEAPGYFTRKGAVTWQYAGFDEDGEVTFASDTDTPVQIGDSVEISQQCATETGIPLPQGTHELELGDPTVTGQPQGTLVATEYTDVGVFFAWSTEQQKLIAT